MSEAIHPDAALLAACARAAVLEAQSNAAVAGRPPLPHCPHWEEASRLADLAYDLWDEAVRLPAQTEEGKQAKARFVLDQLEANGIASEIALSLARDVLGRV